jgi:phosphoglycolate phosphatase
MQTLHTDAVPMGVVSNRDGDMLRNEIRHIGWANYYQTVIAPGEAAKNKPDPAPALLALQRMGIVPTKNVWFVGDTHGDIECALGAGLTAVLVSADDYTGPQPDARFASMVELLAAYRRAAHAPA